MATDHEKQNNQQHQSVRKLEHLVLAVLFLYCICIVIVSSFFTFNKQDKIMLLEKMETNSVHVCVCV